MRKFPGDQYEIFMYLSQQKSFVSFEEINSDLADSITPTSVSVFAKVFADEGFVDLNQIKYSELSIKEQGQKAIDNGFPERKIAEIIFNSGKRLKIGEVSKHGDIEQFEVGKALKWLVRKNLAVKDRGDLIVEEKPSEALFADEILIDKLSKIEKSTLDKLIQNNDDLSESVYNEAISLLKGRESWFSLKERKIKQIKLNEKGMAVVQEGIKASIEVGQLTSDMIASGQWKDLILKNYDVSLEAEMPETGRFHPFMKIIDQSRKVFLEMGFDEIESPHVESGFWDFDALFQPQDHPAREMQDTFFLSRPDNCSLPADELVNKVKNTHENGGDSGSVGWCYKWDPAKAKQAVLRTHTTAATVRSLASNPEGPRKVFCVGRVFRRETIDYKHLPVFYQVDGIIIDKNASFANLLGTLKAFYKKMGFSKFQFRPAFFPYTEPSVEIFVWHHKKKDWIEMGGAGIFRPEVTEPLGCKSPVLAWGLGLERLAMFRYELNDIREIYLPDLKWLREVPACQ